ncbi:MAG: hypothetical protein KGL39_14685 [Patescibacteria group bacterium]|nr:hypothetical protein [Patescibacteria group bacterium]
MSEFDLPEVDIAKRMTLDERLMKVGTPTGLTPRRANAVTQARLQTALSELADGKIDKVSKWLDEVGERSPAEAIRLFMELLEFRMPRLKAAQVIANLTPSAEGQKRLSEYTIEELQTIVAEG